MSGAPQWRVFHLPASDCVILDTWHTSGLRGTGSTDYAMDGVFVADNYVKKHSLLEDSLLPGRRYAYPGFNVPSLSAVALGAARGAVDALTELFGGKVDRRNQRPGGRRPSTSRPTSASPRPRWTRPGPTCTTPPPAPGS